mgnify:CR=1 FL=1
MVPRESLPLLTLSTVDPARSALEQGRDAAGGDDGQGLADFGLHPRDQALDLRQVALWVLRIFSADYGFRLFIKDDTYADPDRFFSFRRATHRGEPTYGRQISLIGLPA